MTSIHEVRPVIASLPDRWDASASTPERETFAAITDLSAGLAEGGRRTAAGAGGGPRSPRGRVWGFATCLATLLALLVPSPGSAAPLRVGVTSVGAVLVVKDGKPTGASVAIWENLAGRLGLQTEYVVLPTIDAAIDAAAKGDVDLFLGPIAVTREREQRLDFTHPLLHSGLRIAVRDERGGSWLEPLGLLLSREVLGLVAALVCITIGVGTLLWWCERKANGRNFPPDWQRGTWEGFWWSISTLMTGGCENKHVDSVAGRILATAWTLVGTGLIALFTGSLAATLTAERIGGAIRGPADLARREIGTEPGIGPDAIRARGGIPLEFNSLDDVFSAADRGLVEALVSENLSLKSALARPGRGPYRVVGPVFDSFDAGIVLKPGSDLREPLNTAILAMREDGTLADMFDRWLGGGE